MKKLTYKKVKKYFKEQGCELLEKEYINSSTKMKYICSCGNESEIRWGNFQQGQRCKKCSGKEKYTFEYIFNYFKEQGCELLEKVYKNACIKMKYKCSCGNESEITWSDFQRGCRCRKCSGSEKLTFEFVYNYFKKNGCELLETEYKNNNIPMKFKCVCGNISKISWMSFRVGCRCVKCGECEKYSFEFVYNYFKENNCELLETEYINNKTKMKYVCSCGNKSEIKLNNFQQGQRCKNCGFNKIKYKISGKNNYRWNLDREYIKNKNIISQRCSNMLHHLLERLHIKKISKTEIYLGYSRQKLYEHIINHPNWNSVKNLNWDIDHIFPISAFIENKIFDIKLINSLDNLQPLDHIENIKKRDHYNKEDFKKYLFTKNIILENI